MSSTSKEKLEVSDDDIFRRKFLMDGADGDNRRIDQFLKEFSEWDNATDQTDEEIKTGHQNLLMTLDSIRLSFRKSQMTQAAHRRELKEYKKIEMDLDENIASTVSRIKALKVELKEAKKINAQKQKCDALAKKVISEQPNRAEMEDQLKHLNEEIAVLGQKNQELNSTFQKRLNTLNRVANAVQDIKAEIMIAEATQDSDA